MTVYLDTSVILSRFLDQANALPEWGNWDQVWTSVLTRVEYHRCVDRLRLEGFVTDDERVELHTRFVVLWGAAHQIPLTEAILSRAGDPFPTIVETLDALHLASALAAARNIVGTLTFLTHDEQLGRAASAMGLRVIGT